MGDKVCALVAGGGYAEYCVVHASNALPVPQGLSMVEAAALPETFFTVWTNVFQRGKLKAGETVLIHGGSSGIGTTATMLSKAFGATVLVTVGSEEKRQACLALGADLAINYHMQDFVEETMKFTGWQRGRRRRRYYRWRLCCQELQGSCAEWPYRPDRCPEWPGQRAEPDDHADQAAYAYRLHLAVT